MFSTIRTESLEKLFKWVRPISDNNYVVMTSKNSNIVINFHSDLKWYTVGFSGGSTSAAILDKENILAEVVPKDHFNALKFERERIDLWFTRRLQGLYLAKSNDATDLKEIYKSLPSCYIYIALNLETNDVVIQQLKKILTEMEADSFIESVLQ